MKVYVNGKNKRNVANFDWTGKELTLTRKSGTTEVIESSTGEWKLTSESTDKVNIFKIDEA